MYAVAIILKREMLQEEGTFGVFFKISQSLLQPHGWIPFYGNRGLAAVKGFMSCTVPQGCEHWSAPRI